MDLADALGLEDAVLVGSGFGGWLALEIMVRATARFGRLVLVYQTDDGKENGVWDQDARQWVPLESAEYRNYIRQGLKIARKQLPPDIFILPVSAAH